MSQSRWLRCAGLAAGAALTAALVAGCGGSGTNSAEPANSGTSASATADRPSGSAGVSTEPGRPTSVEVADPVAHKLCDSISSQLSDWGVQGPTLGRVALNITVHEWAAQNGGINLAVLGDKGSVDRITTKTCSGVRDEALRALELPDLASGIAF